MPAMTGVELHRHPIKVGYPIPTILVTGYPNDVDALNNGVVFDAIQIVGDQAALGDPYTVRVHCG